MQDPDPVITTYTDLLPQRQMTSQFRGVTYSKKSAKWQAAINMGGTHVHLGTYVGEQEAAIAFDRAALIVRGIDKAKINFPVTNYCDANGQLIIDPATAHKLQAGAEKGGARADAEAAEGNTKKKRKKIDPATLGMGADMGGYANYLNSLQFGEGDGGAALLQQYMQMAQRKPDEGAAWSGIMSVATACLPGPSTTTAEDGSEQQMAPPVTRLVGIVPHLSSRAMGVIWEQDPDGTDEAEGTQAHSEENSARDWLASMMDVLAGMGPQAGNAAPANSAPLANGGFPPLASMEEQQQQLAELLGAGAKLQQQQQLAGMVELIASAGAAGGVEALTAALANFVGPDGAGGVDLASLIQTLAGSGGQDLIALMAAAAGGTGEGNASGEQQQEGDNDSGAAAAAMLSGLVQHDSAVAAAAPAAPSSQSQDAAAGSLPLFQG